MKLKYLCLANGRPVVPSIFSVPSSLPAETFANPFICGCPDRIKRSWNVTTFRLLNWLAIHHHATVIIIIKSCSERRGWGSVQSGELKTN